MRVNAKVCGTDDDDGINSDDDEVCRSGMHCGEVGGSESDGGEADGRDSDDEEVDASDNSDAECDGSDDAESGEGEGDHDGGGMCATRGFMPC